MFLRQYLSYLSVPFRSQESSTNVKTTGQKTYHKKATGAALNTVKRHSKEHQLKLFGSCFW
jgi:glutathione S-transferase